MYQSYKLFSKLKKNILLVPLTCDFSPATELLNTSLSAATGTLAALPTALSAVASRINFQRSYIRC